MKGADEKGFYSDCFFLSFRFPVLRTHFFVVLSSAQVLYSNNMFIIS